MLGETWFQGTENVSCESARRSTIADSPWPTNLLRACQATSEWVFDISVATAATRFAPALGVPKHFVVQLLHIEDKRFLLHPGVDPIAIVRAVVANSTRTGVIQGASTITQQLYNVRQEEKDIRRRGFANKVRQAAWALAKEARRSKFEILEEYLRKVYWGSNYHGVDEASSGYFGTSREKLTAAQSFFLVERLAAPNFVRLSRVESLLKRHFVLELLSGHAGACEELVALYDEHFHCGNELRDC